MTILNPLHTPKENPSPDFNKQLLTNAPKLKERISEVFTLSPTYKEDLEKLKLIDHGGFNHGDLSGLYSQFQSDDRYGSTRFVGWKNLFSLLVQNTDLQETGENGLILDFLAGSGTLSKRVKKIWKSNFPEVMGIDVSFKMCEQAKKNGETVFWGAHNLHPFRLNHADACVAAYGFHHVPVEERLSFVENMSRTLNDNGACLIHDFNEGSPSAKFYSELIHTYRTEGHPYKHFTREEFKSILSAHFFEVDIYAIYDPFYLEGHEGQTSESLKKEFLAYIINLFNLEKLIPERYFHKNLINVSDDAYWDKIEEIISPYLTILPEETETLLNNSTPDCLRSFSVPFVTKMSVIQLEEKRYAIIGPRVALVGIGTQRRK